MQTKLGYLFLLSSILASGGVAAESASERLTTLEAETLVLKAREKQLEVQANIIAKQNEILLKQVAADRLTQSTVTGDPVIRAVESIGKSNFATLELANGHIVDVQVGDVISNGMKVVSIRPNEVIVERNKRRTRLSGASQLPAPFNPNYPTVGMSLPPMLPLSLHRGPAK